jgi:lipoprotein-anchoring transpeptidase ErfK/SrfK
MGNNGLQKMAERARSLERSLHFEDAMTERNQQTHPLAPASVLRAALALLSALALAGSAQAADLRIEVDLSAKMLSVYQDGERTETYTIAVGTEAHPTPTGTFEVRRIVWNPAWVPPPNAEWAEDESRQAPGDPDNPMKMAKIFFDEPDYYIHGTGAEASLGTAASHGCIRMDPQEVAELARLLMEHGGEGRSTDWYQRMRRSDDKTEIVLDTALPMRVRS